MLAISNLTLSGNSIILFHLQLDIEVMLRIFCLQYHLQLMATGEKKISVMCLISCKFKSNYSFCFLVVDL